MGHRNKTHRRARALEILRDQTEQTIIKESEATGLSIAASRTRAKRRKRINEARGLNSIPYDDKIATYRARHS